MSDTKLRPEDLRAKAEALIAFTREGPLFIAWVQAVTDTLAPAPEKAAKVECPNCRQKVGPGWDHEATPQRFTCQPAQPEPAATVCEACEGIRSDLCAKCSPDEPAAPEKGAWIADGFGNTWKKCERENCGLEIVRPGKVQCVLCESESVEPAQPEPAAPEMPPMPNAVHNLVLWCKMFSASQYGQGFRSQIKADLDAFTDWWRTHSQPVAHPFKAGFKPDSMRHFAEYVRDNWHYFGTDTAGLAHQFLQEMAAQPVAVGMTEELSMVLLRAEYGATEDERNPNLRDGYVARLKSAIETVRQQAAQVKL
jgi:hypothetical protein